MTKKIKLEYLYKGDYTEEFGGNEPRIWKRYYVRIDGENKGELYVEPEDYKNRYQYRNGDDFITAKNLRELKLKLQ